MMGSMPAVSGPALDDVIKLVRELHDVEGCRTRLTELKTALADVNASRVALATSTDYWARLQQQLAAKEAALDGREQALADRAAALNEREAALAEREAKFRAATSAALAAAEAPAKSTGAAP